MFLGGGLGWVPRASYQALLQVSLLLGFQLVILPAPKPPDPPSKAWWKLLLFLRTCALYPLWVVQELKNSTVTKAKKLNRAVNFFMAFVFLRV